jgi:hypothetical protein
MIENFNKERLGFRVATENSLPDGQGKNMDFDVFFSLSQTPVRGHLPKERDMFAHFFDQVCVADECGYGCVWIAESHFSTEVQKSHTNPVVPHWHGEIGLNADFIQIAHRIFAQTRKIEVGSAVMNLLVNGGPVAAAERLAMFASLHGMNPSETRKLRVGFAQGRFDFMSRAFGVVPRNAFEEAHWGAVRAAHFREASEVFLRLLGGETVSSNDITPPCIERGAFREPDGWHMACQQAGVDLASQAIPLERRYVFDRLKIIPQDFRRDLLVLIAGTHDPEVQIALNQICPVQIFNLSITQPEVIEATHKRMETHYHTRGGAWRRSFMPRTVMVFLNAEHGLSSDEQRACAQAEAQEALEAYWQALEGTLDPEKVRRAADNAVVGNASDVARQISERFHPEDRLMLWFDFFNHDSARVMRNMTAFARAVIPRVGRGI